MAAATHCVCVNWKVLWDAVVDKSDERLSHKDNYPIKKFRNDRRPSLNNKWWSWNNQRHINQSAYVFICLICDCFCNCLHPMQSDLIKILVVFISTWRHSHPEQNKRKINFLVHQKRWISPHFTLNKFWSSTTRQLAAPPTLSCSSSDRDPLQNLDVSTSFSFLQILLDVQQQHLHCVNSILDVRDTVQDGERSSDVFTEQWLSAQRAGRKSLKKEKLQRKLCCSSEWVINSILTCLWCLAEEKK